MKKFWNMLAMATLVTATATTAFADGGKRISCELEINTADRAGYLMPSSRSIIISGKLNDGNMLSKGLDAYLSSCASQTALGMNVKLCASTTEFQGVYDVGLLIDGRDTSTAASTTLGTSKADGKSLLTMAATSAVTPEMVSRLSNAGIEVPDEMRGDSLQVDEALKAASKKGLIKGDEIVTVGIKGCAID